MGAYLVYWNWKRTVVLGPVFGHRDEAEDEVKRRNIYPRRGWTWVELGITRDFVGYALTIGGGS